MHASAAGPVLDVTEVSCRFGGVLAVDRLSIRVAPGELVGVVGPNGAGKSTLIGLITGLVRPTSGSIALGDHRLVGRTPDSIAALGVARTFQTSRVFPGLTVWESVMVGAQPALIGGGRYGGRMNALFEVASALVGAGPYSRRQATLARRAEEVLSLFGERLLPRRTHLASSLSFANRRRLELARALVSDPLILLLDEPTAGMNPSESDELAGLIAALHAEHSQMGVVLVEHKMSVVRRLCHRVVVMNEGSIIAEGSPGGVLEDERVIEAYLGHRSVGAPS